MTQHPDIKPFKDNKIKLTVTPSKNGVITNFEIKDGTMSLDESSIDTEKIMDKYQHIGEELADRLYNNDNPDRAYKFGNYVLQQSTRNPSISEDHILHILEFNEYTTDTLRKYIKFAEMYPDEEYHENTPPELLVDLAEDRDSVKEAKSVLRPVLESDINLSQSVIETWYNIDEFTAENVCEKIANTKSKSKLNAVKLVYLLEGVDPPSDEKIEETLPDQTSDIDKSTNGTTDSSSEVETLEMEETNATEKLQNKSNDEKIEAFIQRKEKLSDNFEGHMYDYHLGNLIDEFYEKHGLSINDIADEDILDRSSSNHLYALRKAAKMFDEDTFPDMPVGHIYDITNRIDDEEEAIERFIKADEINETAVNATTRVYLMKNGNASIEDAYEEITGRSTKEIVDRIQMAFILNGQSAPSVEKIYNEIGEEPPTADDDIEQDKTDEHTEESPDSTETDADVDHKNHEQVTTDEQTNDDRTSHQQIAQNAEAESETSKDESKDETSETSQESTEDTTAKYIDQNIEEFKEDVAEEFLNTDHAEEIIESEDVTYESDRKLLIPDTYETKESINGKYSGFVPSADLIDKLMNVLTDWEQILTFKNADNTRDAVNVVDIDSVVDLLVGNDVNNKHIKDSGGLYTIKDHTHNPLVICWPEQNERIAMAIETYANNGGDTVVFIGERNNNANPTDKIISSLEDNFSLQARHKTIQWRSNSDTLNIYTTNN